MPKVLTPMDRAQSPMASQSTRMSRPGSSSHWSPSEVPVSGATMELTEDVQKFQLVAAWDGIVTEVADETFVVRIVRLDGAGAEEEAEFLIADVPEEDRPLLKPRRTALLVPWL